MGLKRRWQNGQGYRNQSYFNNAIKKYGWDNFSHEVLAENLTQNEAYKLEQYYISLYKSNRREFGYNMSSGGEVLDHSGICVAQLYKNEIVNVFYSISDAERKIDLSDSAIGNYIHGDYKWEEYSFKIITQEEYDENIDNNNEFYIQDFLQVFRKLQKEAEQNKLNELHNMLKRPVNMYSLDGKYIKTFKSMVEAERDLDITCIAYAIRTQKSAAGYMWRYDEGNYEDISPYNNRVLRKVAQIDKDTNKVINVFSSMKEAEKKTGVNSKQIWKVCNKENNRQKAGGYMWEYIENVGGDEIGA